MVADPCAKASILLQKGDKEGASKNLLRCKKKINQLIRKAKRDPVQLSRLKLQLARVLNLEGQIYLSNNKSKKAHSLFLEAKTVLKNYKNIKEAIALGADLDYSLAAISQFNQENSKAREYYEKAKMQYLVGKEFEKAINTMFRLVEIQMKNSNFTLARETYELIYRTSKKIRDKKNRKRVEAKSLLGKGKLMYILGDKKAQKVLTKVRKLFSKNGDFEGEIEAIIELTVFEDKEQAIELLNEAFKLAEKNDLARFKGIILTKLGINLLTSGQFKKGQEYLLNGLDYRLQAGDKNGTAQTLLELSRITFLTARNDEDLKKAKEFAMQSDDIYNQIENPFGKAQSLEMLGSINTKLGILDEAYSQIQLGRKIFKQQKDKNAEARMLTQLGIIMDLQNRREDVDPILKRAIKLYQATSNNQGLAEVYHLLGMIEIDKTRAIKFLKDSRDLYIHVLKYKKELQPIIIVLDSKIHELEK